MTDVLIAAKNAATQDPVDEVLVRIYNSDLVLMTQGTTGEGGNDPGERLFNLAQDTYSMRLSMGIPGYSVVSPQSFTVTGVPEDDIFDVSVTLFSAPVATNPSLCRCSGFFLNPDGSPAVGIKVALQYLSVPAMLGSSAVLSKKLFLTTDSSGYIQTDLIRGASYRIDMEGYSDVSLETRVPNTSSANLPDILLPIVTEVSFSSSSVTLAVGATYNASATLTFRSGLSLVLSEFTSAPVTFSSSGAGLSVSVSNGQLALTGVTAGTYTVTASRVVPDVAIQASPDAGFSSGTLTVTVT